MEYWKDNIVAYSWVLVIVLMIFLYLAVVGNLPENEYLYCKFHSDKCIPLIIKICEYQNEETGETDKLKDCDFFLDNYTQYGKCRRTNDIIMENFAQMCISDDKPFIVK